MSLVLIGYRPDEKVLLSVNDIHTIQTKTAVLYLFITLSVTFDNLPVCSDRFSAPCPSWALGRKGQDMRKPYKDKRVAMEALTEVKSTLWGRFADKDGDCGNVIEYVRNEIQTIHSYIGHRLIEKQKVLEALWLKSYVEFGTTDATLREMGFEQWEIDSFRDDKLSYETIGKATEESVEDDCADNN